MRLIALRITLGVITAFQIVLGLMFLFAPDFYPAAVGLAAVPEWAHWMFAMFSARALGFAAGLVLAIRDPLRHRAWIAVMLGVQAIDWIATTALVLQGTLTIAQVSTAGFMPVLFIIALALTFPRHARETVPKEAAEEAPESVPAPETRV